MSEYARRMIADQGVKCPNCRDPHGTWTVRIRTFVDHKNYMYLHCGTCSNLITFRVGDGHR